jgi:hypothetical protein
LTNQNVFARGVNVGDRVDEFLFKLNVSRVAGVFHAIAELNHEVPTHKLTVLAVVEMCPA